MAQTTIKSKSSIYKHVQFRTSNGHDSWSLTFYGMCRKGYKTEREAGIAADKILISKGKDPVNILKRKTLINL